MDHPFRSAAFGGFNRQDVLTYLENLSREEQQQREALQQELEQARETASRQEGELNELHARLKRLEQEKEEVSTQLVKANSELVQSRADCEQKAADLAALGRELEDSRAAAASMQPDAQAYRELKERTAGVELEAHRRAQAIQEKAEGDARDLRRRMEQWMQRMNREYDALRTEVETTVSHAAAQLDKAGQTLEQVNELLNQREAALESLAQAYADTDPIRVAAPMPIPEQE